MTVSQTPPKAPEGKQLKRAGTVGIAIGALAILVCELPIILAVLGLGELSAGVMALRPPPIIEIEIVAIIIAIVGAVLLLFVLVRRIITPQKRSQP